MNTPSLQLKTRVQRIEAKGGSRAIPQNRKGTRKQKDSSGMKRECRIIAPLRPIDHRPRGIRKIRSLKKGGWGGGRRFPQIPCTPNQLHLATEKGGLRATTRKKKEKHRERKGADKKEKKKTEEEYNRMSYK